MGDKRAQREALGWNYPGLTRHDLGSKAISLASWIRNAQIEEFDRVALATIADYPKRIDLLKIGWGAHYQLEHPPSRSLSILVGRSGSSTSSP